MRKEGAKALAAILGFYLILELFGITCPILYITGISCAGCGMSRAWLSLMRFDFAAAFFYHPLFWLPAPTAMLVLFRRRVPERVYRGGLWVVCALFLGVYLYRMFFLDDPVVVFRPDQGLIGRVILSLLGKSG